MNPPDRYGVIDLSTNEVVEMFRNKANANLKYYVLLKKGLYRIIEMKYYEKGHKKD
jgi:hypothetical protein